MERQEDKIVFDYIYDFFSRKRDILFNYDSDLEKFSLMFFEFMKEYYPEIYKELYFNIREFNYNYSLVNNREFFQLFYFFIQKDAETDNKTTITEEFLNAKQYIMKYLKKSIFYLNLVNRQFIIEEASEYFADLLLSNGHDSEEIMNRWCDNNINRYAFIDNIRANSVSEPVFSFEKAKDNVVETSKKLKDKVLGMSHKKEKLALLIAILILSGIISNFAIKDINNQKENSNLEIVSIIDDYGYDDIGVAYDSVFYNTFKHLINIFPEYIAKNNDNGIRYEQIPLYRAYSSINVDIEYYNKAGIYTDKNPLVVMDMLFLDLQQSFDKDSDFQNYTCYVDYVYNMMKNSGINVDKYTDAVKHYILQTANYKRISPYNILSKEDKKSIDDMLGDYEKVYRDILDSLADDLEKNNNGRGM